MSLATPPKVEKLQTALHAKAKAAPAYRFYALYDKVYRPDILAHAYQRCHANQGAAGVDGESFQDIEAYGVERWLAALTQELQNWTYQPKPVKRVWIPKPDGKQRPLGIPTIRDRVVQMAAVLVLEPIFEADLPSEQFAYRPEKSAQGAAMRVRELIRTGYTDVVDADLSGYFDSIPHHELMKCVARRISDPHVLHLIKMWLEAPVAETDEQGRKSRTTRNKDEGRGTPQGAVISPLLANLYMRRFLVGFKQLGHAERLKAHIVNYADDFVICSRGHAVEAMAVMQDMMAKLKLTVNEQKTRRCHLPEEKFTFLGYTFGRYYSRRTGGAYLGLRPSTKKVQQLVRDDERVNGSPNLLAVGHGQGSPAQPQVTRLGELLQSGHCQPGLRYGATSHLSQAATVAVLQARRAAGEGCTLSHRVSARQASPGAAWCLAPQLAVGERMVIFVREPDAGNLHVRFDEREVETEQGELLRHRQPKGSATARLT